MNKPMWTIGILLAVLGGSAAPVDGLVNLELRPLTDDAMVGELVQVALYAVSDPSTSQDVSGMQVILQWDPALLELDTEEPVLNNGPYTWIISGFEDDSSMDGLNDTFADGNAYYQAAGNFLSMAQATPEGLLVTTFQFRARGQGGDSATLQCIPSMGAVTVSAVVGPSGTDITGTLGETTIEIGWGRLSVEPPLQSCGAIPGESVTIQIRVSDLPEAISGVQAVIDFDDSRLTLDAITRGDGLGSPWDSSLLLYEHVAGGRIEYALGLLPPGSALDAVVATLEFEYLPTLSGDSVLVEIVPQSATLQTQLRIASTGVAAFPELVGPSIVISAGDWDADGDVDLDDYTGFENCLAGPGVSYAQPECCRVDMDRDLDVDLADFAGWTVLE